MDNLGHLCTYQVAPTTPRLYKEKFVWLFVAEWLKTLVLCHAYTYSIVFFICICYYIKLIISMIHIVFHSLLPRVERFTNKWTILDVYNANLEKGIQWVKLNDFFLSFFFLSNHWHNYNLHLEMNHTSSQVLEKKFWKEIKRNHKQSCEKVALFWLHNSSNAH